MRELTIWVPQMVVRMTLFEGTPDAEMFEVKCLNSDPYVKAYGEKVFLTSEETQEARRLKKAANKMKKGFQMIRGVL